MNRAQSLPPTAWPPTPPSLPHAPILTSQPPPVPPSPFRPPTAGPSSVPYRTTTTIRRTATQAEIPSMLSQVDMIPLIKSPSFRVPPPVELPPDIHPLPEDVTAYFVYPHTLESHALRQLPSTLSSLHTRHSQRLHLLASFAESKERARKARLNQLAPGWGEGLGVMEPVRRESVLVGPPTTTSSSSGRGARKHQNTLKEEEEEEQERGERDLLAGSEDGEMLMGSPKEMGQGTIDQYERDQMEALVQGLAAMDGKRGSKEDGIGSLF